MIVLDASAALELLLDTPTAAPLGTRVFAPAETVAAPHLLDLEVAQVLRRYTRTQECSVERGRQALADLSVLPIQRYPHDILLPRIWQLRNNMTAYDAAYIALAEALSAPLLTCDSHLAHASGHRATVELISIHH